jgi:hypothetical protein
LFFLLLLLLLLVLLAALAHSAFQNHQAVVLFLLIPLMLVFKDPRPGRPGYFLSVEKKDEVEVQEGFRVRVQEKEFIIVAIKKISDDVASLWLTVVNSSD